MAVINIEKFSRAKPIWGKDKLSDMNQTLLFRFNLAKKAGSRYELKITGCSAYRVFINEKYIASGPARCAHGYYRMDKMDITEHLNPGSNIIVAEVVGYNIYSYCCAKGEPFIQAEIIDDNGCVAGLYR